jgi:putative heme transporter
LAHPTESAESSGTRPKRRWLKRGILLALALVCAYVIIDRVGRIDWGAVRDALGHLTWWQPLVLLVVLAVRQVLNAIPLHFYIEGVSVTRATQNDLGAILMAMIAPSPADYALRVAMFTSWGIPAARGAAGALMNTLTFYVVRFSAPIIGFVILAIVDQDASYRWGDLISVAIAAGIVVGVMLVLHSDALARTVGLRTGRVFRRFRRTVEPEAWAQACVDFRGHIASRFRYGFPRSLAGMAAMLIVDLALLVLCLRFVGVAASEVSVADIAIAYFFAYPLTILPFTGIGIVDSLIVAAVVEAGGAAVEAPAVAGLIVWRVFTLGVPVLAGLGAVALWRRTPSGRAATP